MDRQHAIRLQSETRDGLVAMQAEGIEVGEVLGGGPAGCKELDRRALDQYERQGGRVGPYNALTLFEADWIASTTGLFYVVPRVPYACGWRWSTIRVTPGRTVHFAPRGSEVLVEDSEGVLSLKVSRAGAEDLVAIAAKFTAH